MTRRCRRGRRPSRWLVRDPHGVTLTAAGRTLLTEGKALLAHAAQRAAPARRSATASSTVTVTSPGCGAVLPDRLVRLRRRLPAARVRACVGTVDDQLDRLRSGRADIALWRGPVPGPGFDSRLLFASVATSWSAPVTGWPAAGRSPSPT